MKYSEKNARVVFLDRDGTININPLPHEYIIEAKDFVLLDGVGEAITKLNQLGFKIIIISNQRGVARGLFSKEQLERVNNKMLELLKEQGAHVDEWFYCKHNEQECECRKPKIGLFLKAEEKFKIDKVHSYMIGDSESDIEAGKNYGVTTIKLGQACGADYSCNNLVEAVKWIMERENIWQY